MIALGVVLNAAFSYFYWGLGLALAPLIAIHFSAAAEEKGIPVDFPFLLATIAAAQSVWQFGLSASAPLLMATPGHFLQDTVGVMDLRTTIWSAPALLMVSSSPPAVILLARLLMPRQVTPLSRFPEASALVSAACRAAGGCRRRTGDQRLRRLDRAQPARRRRARGGALLCGSITTS